MNMPTAFVLSSSPVHSININVSAGDSHRYATVRFKGWEIFGVKYTGTLRFNDETGTGWLRVAADANGNETAYSALYCTRTSDICKEPTEAAKKKILELGRELVGAWEREHGTVAFTIAGLENAQETADGLDEKINKLETSLKAARSARGRARKLLGMCALSYSAALDNGSVAAYNENQVAL